MPTTANTTLIYIDKLPATMQATFALKVKQIAARLGIENPNWLMQVMYAESGLNPKAVNRTSNATGLIQFMPSTAISLGTTTTALYNMNALDQLNYVEKYFLPYRSRLKSYFDVYLAVFFPAAIGKKDDYVFQTSSLPASLIAKQNPVINKNKDGKITLAEFKQYVVSTVAPSLRDLVFSQVALASISLASIILFFSLLTT